MSDEQFNDVHYHSPDGRECFVIFNRENKLVYVGVDIHSNEFPVGLTSAALRDFANTIDALSYEEPADDPTP